jgi:hypothetical protein
MPHLDKKFTSWEVFAGIRLQQQEFACKCRRSPAIAGNSPAGKETKKPLSKYNPFRGFSLKNGSVYQ